MPGSPSVPVHGSLFGAALIGDEFYTVYEGEPLFLCHFPSPQEAPSVDTHDVYANFLTPTYISSGVPYVPFIPKCSPWYGELLGLFGSYNWQNIPIVQVKPGKWAFDPAHVVKWYELEAKLQCVAQALLEGVPFRPKGFRPFGLPHRIGYMAEHSSEKAARHAILKSRDGFLPLIAQISLFIFLHKIVENFDSVDWRAKVQKDARVTAAWWDQLERSAAGDMTIPRIGGVLDLRLHPGNDPSEKTPFDEIFAAVISFSVPMPLYIRWGKINDNKPQIPIPPLLSAMGLIPDSAEQTYLRAIQGPVRFSPWDWSIKEHDNPGSGHVSGWVAFYDLVKEMTFRSQRNDKPFTAPHDATQPELETEAAPAPVRPFPPVEKHSGQRAGETISSFLARRKSAREKAMANENGEQKQRREQREANASTGAVPGKKARVYVWELRDGHYIRTAAGRDNYEDVWETYPESQRMYDSTTNEWDVCETFGTNEDEEDLRPYTVIDFDTEDDDQPLTMGPDTMQNENPLNLLTPVASLAPVLPAADTDVDLPPSSPPTETAEQLAELRFGCYFPGMPVVVSGLLLPRDNVAAKVLGDKNIPLPVQGKRDTFLTFLAQCREFKTPRDIDSIHVDFHDPGSALNQSWEVDVQRVSCITDGASLKGGLRYVICETDNPGALCLVLESATTVLEVIRRKWGRTVDQVAQHLLSRGMPFHFGLPSEPMVLVPAPSSRLSYSGLGYRSQDYQPDVWDYRSYLERRRQLLRSSRGLVALRSGGIIARIAREVRIIAVQFFDVKILSWISWLLTAPFVSIPNDAQPLSVVLGFASTCRFVVYFWPITLPFISKGYVDICYASVSQLAAQSLPCSWLEHREMLLRRVLNG
ncbi:hypothetical protein MSAN_01826100 [Mycena sanguinolenta]|uniref:Uncharacterized protein n=1 Tax=Mycena sanguinolenta TaxID=230812 RepID=A0A8H6XUZ9_9AGAR|nr:hypothetical protein MSAN_01826100 [Mycena sanguinolenta]